MKSRKTKTEEAAEDSIYPPCRKRDEAKTERPAERKEKDLLNWGGDLCETAEDDECTREGRGILMTIQEQNPCTILQFPLQSCVKLLPSGSDEVLKY